MTTTYPHRRAPAHDGQRRAALIDAGTARQRGEKQPVRLYAIRLLPGEWPIEGMTAWGGYRSGESAEIADEKMGIVIVCEEAAGLGVAPGGGMG